MKAATPPTMTNNHPVDPLRVRRKFLGEHLHFGNASSISPTTTTFHHSHSASFSPPPLSMAMASHTPTSAAQLRPNAATSISNGNSKSPLASPTSQLSLSRLLLAKLNGGGVMGGDAVMMGDVPQPPKWGKSTHQQNSRQHGSRAMAALFPVHILPYLYLGNDETARNRQMLRKCRIRYVINVTSNLPNYFEKRQQKGGEQEAGNNSSRLSGGGSSFDSCCSTTMSSGSSSNDTNFDACIASASSSNHACSSPPPSPTICYLRIPVEDGASHDLSTYFPQAIAFIERARADCTNIGGGGHLDAAVSGSGDVDGPPAVLVHCWAGISRSVTVCLAYLMHALDASLDEAFDLLHAHSGTIAPNFHFMESLAAWEKRLRAQRGHNDNGGGGGDGGGGGANGETRTIDEDGSSPAVAATKMKE